VDALAVEGILAKKKVLRKLQMQEQQRSYTRKIRVLWGKISEGGTTMVSIQDHLGNRVDLTKKQD